MPENYCSVVLACYRLNVSHETVRAYIRAGRLRAVKMRGRLFIISDSLDALLAEREKPEPINWKDLRTDKPALEPSSPDELPPKELPGMRFQVQRAPGW